MRSCYFGRDGIGAYQRHRDPEPCYPALVHVVLPVKLEGSTVPPDLDQRSLLTEL